jgi:hypothetical protein
MLEIAQGQRPTLLQSTANRWSLHSLVAQVDGYHRSGGRPKQVCSQLQSRKTQNVGSSFDGHHAKNAVDCNRRKIIVSLQSTANRLAALTKVHRSHGVANPTSSELVKSVLRGLKRVKGTAQRQATPLLKEDLIVALDATGEGLTLLLIGFAGGLSLDWMRVLWLRVLQGHGVGAVQDDPREAADGECYDAR